MNKVVLVFIFKCLACSLVAQDKHDFTWLLGYPPVSQEEKFGGSLLKFDKNDVVKVSFSDIGLMLFPVGEICDKEGNLQFYSNGCEVFNADHKQMENGDSLNYPYFTKYEWQIHDCFQGFSYPNLYNGLLPLPLPGSDSEYVLFHLRHGKVPDPAHFPLYATQSLLYSQINMSANNGLGRVSKKNILILNDTFCDHLAAVRHGNGRDWWLVAQKADTDSAFSVLVDPDGVKGPFSQKIGVEWPTIPGLYMGWQACFSPQGDRYARVNVRNGIHLYDFDRCKGSFGNTQIIPFPDTLIYARGLAFSPNGRWLYFSTGVKLFQYDCYAQDIDASKILIAEYDGFTTQPVGLSTTFHQMQLAPDGKIYMSATNAVFYLHIIHNPNAKGEDCHFEQHGIELPSYNGFCLPNFPNFRLYNWAGSPCDSLISVNAEVSKVQYFSITAFPNPTDQRMTVNLPIPLTADGKLRIYSFTGTLMQEVALISGVDKGMPSFDVSSWPSGVYFVVCDIPNIPIQTIKVIVSHTGR